MELYFKGFIIKVFKYLLLFTFLLSLNLFAGSQRLQKEMNYEVSYEKALEKALKQNKPIMMMIGQTECPYCNKFEVKTLTRKNINIKVQKDFIPLSLLRDKDKFPKQFEAKGVPTVIFIDPKQQKAFYKSFGYKSKRDYKVELEKALEIYNKEYKN